MRSAALRADQTAPPRNDENSSSDQGGVDLARAARRLGITLRLQQLDDLSIGARPAEQKALRLAAAFGAQATQLVLGLDALGGDRDAEPRAETDDGADDRLRLAIGARSFTKERSILILSKGKLLR